MEQKVAEPDESFVQRLRFSARGYKSRLTLACQAQENLLNLFAAGPSTYGAQQLHDGVKALQRTKEPLMARIQELMETAPDDKQYEAYDKDLKEYSKRVDKMAAKTAEAIGEAGYTPMVIEFQLQNSRGEMMTVMMTTTHSRQLTMSIKFQDSTLLCVRTNLPSRANQRSSGPGYRSSKPTMPPVQWTH